MTQIKERVTSFLNDMTLKSKDIDDNHKDSNITQQEVDIKIPINSDDLYVSKQSPTKTNIYNLDYKDTPIEYSEMYTEFKNIDKEAKELFYKKNADYGPTNISLGRTLKNQIEKDAAIIGVAIRLRDKTERLINMVLHKKLGNTEYINNESIEDTLLDIHNYANIGLILKRDKWAK